MIMMVKIAPIGSRCFNPQIATGTELGLGRAHMCYSTEQTRFQELERASLHLSSHTCTSGIMILYMLHSCILSPPLRVTAGRIQPGSSHQPKVLGSIPVLIAAEHTETPTPAPG